MREMSFFIAVFLILLTALNIAYIFGKRFEFTLPVVTAGISFLLYICGYAGSLPLGVALIILGMLASVAGAIYKKQKQPDVRFWATAKTPGFAYVTVMVLIIAFLSYGFMFTTWDEFSNWGLVLKNMFIHGNFGNVEGSTLHFPTYPESVSLFLYFCMRLSGSFAESAALSGLILLAVSQLALFATQVKWGEWKKMAIVFVILLTFPLIFFGTLYSNIYQDAIMGLIFGNILCFNFLYRKKDWFYGLYMTLQFCLLAGVKQLGLILVLTAGMVILADIWCTYNLKLRRQSLLEHKKLLLLGLLPLAVAGLVFISWKLFIRFHDIPEDYLSKVHASDLVALLKGTGPEFREKAIVDFLQRFFVVQQFGVVTLSYFLWYVGLLVGIHCLNRQRQKQEQRPFLPYLFTIPGLLCYFALMLFTYLFLFTESEAVSLASYERYVASFIIGPFMLCLLMAIGYITNRSAKALSPTIYLGFLLVGIISLVPMTSFNSDTWLTPHTNLKKRQMRAPYEKVGEYAKIFDEKRDKVYIISQHQTGGAYWILRYNLTPIQTAPNLTWSLGKPYDAQDQWSRNISVSEWAAELKREYTLVFIDYADKRFKNEYGSLFEDKTEIVNGQFYRVKPAGSSVKLEKTLATAY
jgi:hypothetical protein